MDKKQLNDEELEKVTGGVEASFEGDLSKYNSIYTKLVDKYSGVIGKDYLFKRDDKQWLFGTLRNSYENKWFNERYHDVYVKDGVQYIWKHGYEKSFEVSEWGTREVSGDDYTMYEN